MNKAPADSNAALEPKSNGLIRDLLYDEILKVAIRETSEYNKQLMSHRREMKLQLKEAKIVELQRSRLTYNNYNFLHCNYQASSVFINSLNQQQLAF